MTQHQDPTPDQGIPDGNGGFIPLDVYCSKYKHVKGNFYIRLRPKRGVEPDTDNNTVTFNYEFDLQGEEVEGKACIEGDFLCNGSGQTTDLHELPSLFDVAFNTTPAVPTEFGRASCRDDIYRIPNEADYTIDADFGYNPTLEEPMNVPLEVGKAHVSLRAFTVYDNPDAIPIQLQQYTQDTTIEEFKACRECNIPGLTGTNIFGEGSFLDHGIYTVAAGFACKEANGGNADDQKPHPDDSPYADPLRFILNALSQMCSIDETRRPRQIHICWEYLEHLDRELCEYEVNEDQNGNVTVDWIPEECDLKTVKVWMQQQDQIDNFNRMAIALGQNTRFVRDDLTHMAGHGGAWPIDEGLRDRICDLAVNTIDCLYDHNLTYEDSTAMAKCIDDEMPSAPVMTAILLSSGMEGLFQKFGEILNTCICDQFD